MLPGIFTCGDWITPLHKAWRHPLLTICCCLLTLACNCPRPANAALVDLDFSNNIEATSATSPNGFPMITATTIHFEEVASGIDLLLQISLLGSGHSFLGVTPNYTAAGGEPDNDLGFFYESITNGATGGIRAVFSFYQSDNLVNSIVQLTTPVVLDAANIMVYDVDGEATQSELARAYYQDGLRNYQVRQNAPRLTVTDDGQGTYNFIGPNVNRNENDIRAAAILHYDDTSSFTIDFISTLTSGAPNPVFSGFDGDISFVPSMVNGPFGPLQATSAPEPAGLLLAGAAFAAFAGLRRKKSGSAPEPVK